jgi:4-amino-4-deoxy-L-arabinose transferase-like glycosyltransferase
MTATPTHEDRKHIFLSLLLSLLVKIPISPYFYPFPDRDSGVFAYIGRRILNGDLPYRDVWDHKPPLIFYLNALGLKIAPDSLWGIWLLSVILLAVAIFCSLKLLSRLFNSEIALVSTVIAMGGIPVLLGLGNLKTK